MQPKRGAICDCDQESWQGAGELRAAAAGGRKRQRAISAAVEEPEDKHKPERFFGNRKADAATRGGPLRRAGESPLGHQSENPAADATGFSLCIILS